MPRNTLIAVLSRRQKVLICADVLKHLSKYRQRYCWQTEAGGQLFAHFCGHEVRIVRATGPNRSDDRTRFAFRSDPVIAQQHITAAHRDGLQYIGEWHTHAERVPIASHADYDAVSTLLRESSLNITSLLLIIRGTAMLPDGLALYRFYTKGYEQVKLTQRDGQGD